MQSRQLLSGCFIVVVTLSVAGCGGKAEPELESQAPNAELDRSARRIVTFLQGEGSIDDIPMAETVTLHLGGLAKRTVASNELGELANWMVSDSAGNSYSFLPQEGLSSLTTRTGSHFNCLEYELSSLVPELADMPHVGTMLNPSALESCLESWNMTMVFDPQKEPPALVAVVHDRWEW